MKTIGLTIIGFALLGGYLIFFKLAPWISGLLPPGDWTPILKVIVYILIGWCGGIALPITLLILGFGLFVKGL